MKLSIIIPTFNNQKELKENLYALYKSDFKDFNITVIDDASTDNTKEMIEKNFPKISYIRNKKNQGPAYSRNIGIKQNINKSDYLLFLDSDVEIAKNTIHELYNSIKSKTHIAAATPTVYFFDDKTKIQYSIVDVGLITGINYSKKYERKDQISVSVKSMGGNFIIKSKILKEIGLFDERYKIYYEDADIAARIIKAGYKILYVPKAKIWHKYPLLNEVDANKRWLSHAYLTSRNKLIFMKKHSKHLYLYYLLVPIYLSFYIFKAIKYRQFKAIKEFICGIIDGLNLNVKHDK